FLTGQRQGGGCPTTCRHRDELILPVWETALEVLLEWQAARADPPGAVVLLSLEQKCNPAPVDPIRRRQGARGVERDQHGAGGVGVARHPFRLAPAAILPLRPE